jgi:hypothetical protein
MLELAMAAARSHQGPAVVLEYPQQITYLHPTMIAVDRLAPENSLKEPR